MEWYQQALTAPDVYEGTVKVGVIPDSDHVQVWWEVKDPTTGVLLAQGSQPHGDVRALPELIAWAAERVRMAIEQRCEPF